MFYFDRIVWVIHRRFRCQECPGSVSAIDPRLLSMLPDRVSDQFPFVSAGNRWVGMHKFMLFMFVELITSRVQFGTFSKVINTIYSLKYDMSCLFYYKSFIDWKQNKAAAASFLGVGEYPEPFGKFDSV